MIVHKKHTKKILYKIILYSTIMTLLYALYGLNLITIAVIGFLTVRILFLALDVKGCKQETVHEINVKNGNFHIDDKTFPLQGAYLFFRLRECGENSAVSLYLEEGRNVETIFQDIIFSPSEFEAFLKLIAPYRKINVFPWNKHTTHDTLFVCKEGFFIDGRAFFYDEVENITWKTTVHHEMTAKRESVLVSVDLKNGEGVIENFWSAKETLYAKLLYVSMRVNGEKIEKVTGNKKFVKAFDAILKTLQTKECASL